MTSMQLIEKSFVGSSKFLAAASTTYIHSSREIGLPWMYWQLLLPKSQPPTTEKHEQTGDQPKNKKRRSMWEKEPEAQNRDKNPKSKLRRRIWWETTKKKEKRTRTAATTTKLTTTSNTALFK
jgi:hypothetical protein